jgi:2-iminobutanoate/2-iminopropanoate deaminase
MLERVTLGQEAASYSAAVIATGRLAFISGHGPLTNGEVVRGTIAEETTLTLPNLVHTVESVGGSKERIVKCNCYRADISEFPTFDAAYRSFFGSSFPARTTVGAPLFDGIKVEIEALVALDT